MKHYRLVYMQPYEYDDDTPSGIGDHQVGYYQQTSEFEAFSDSDAGLIVRTVLREGGLDFGVHPGSPPAGHYWRRFMSLVEFKPDRTV